MKRGRHPEPLPSPGEVRVFGTGKSRVMRALYAEHCSVDEIAAFLHAPPAFVSAAVRWKAGPSPRCLSRARGFFCEERGEP